MNGRYFIENSIDSIKRKGNVKGKSYIKMNSMIFLLKKEKEIRLANNFT